jgi:hypothetical protein
LVEKLVEMEDAPWGDLKGRPLDSRGLARRLREYGIRPKLIRLGTPIRGYDAADFIDAWERYLPQPPANSVTTVTSVTGEAPPSHDVTPVTVVTLPRRDGGDERPTAPAAPATAQADPAALPVSGRPR